MRSVVSLLTVILLLTSIAQSETNPFDQSEELVFTTSTGLEQYFWLIKSESDNPVPLIITLHMIDSTHETFASFISALQEFVENDSSKSTVMPHLINFDLRGHGKSIIVKRDTFLYEDMRQPHWRMVPDDINETINYVLKNTEVNINPSEIIVIGASIGANLAPIVANMIPNTKKVAMLSASQNWRGIKPLEAMEKFDGKILLQVRKRDHYTHNQCQELVKNYTGDNLDFRVYPERGHGTDIFKHDNTAMDDLLNWLFDK